MTLEGYIVIYTNLVHTGENKEAENLTETVGMIIKAIYVYESVHVLKTCKH